MGKILRRLTQSSVSDGRDPDRGRQKPWSSPARSPLKRLSIRRCDAEVAAAYVSRNAGDDMFPATLSGSGSIDEIAVMVERGSQ